MLSHMLDCQLYGLHPAGHHFTSIMLHAATSVALFLILWRMTTQLWPSALVAALFALHPLRVESVAWIAERRDVLSGFFFMLTLGAYDEFTRHPRSLRRYLTVAGLFVLGLLAKPMLVTLPPLLLLLDFWPLGRFGNVQSEAAEADLRPPQTFRRLILEKLPLVALAVAAAGVTMHTHGKWHDPLTMPERLANAVVSQVAYLQEFFVPVGLSPYYAHPETGLPAWQVAAALVLLTAITGALWIFRRSCPYLLVGWLWYVGMLVPVLGLASVGGHAHADRYTYLSQIGLYIALIWGAAQLYLSRPVGRWVLGVGSGLILAALIVCSWRQLGYWQNDETLWVHALECDPKNVTAHYNLGLALEKIDESAAVEQYRRSAELDPHEKNIYSWTRAKAHDHLGKIADRHGDLAAAIAHYRQAVEADPDSALARMNLGDLLLENHDLDGAIVEFQRGVELSPDSAPAYCRLGYALSQKGKIDEAIADFHQAASIDPSSFNAHANLATFLAVRGDLDEAILHFRRAIEISPHVVVPYQRLADLLRMQGKTGEAAVYDEQGKQAGRHFAETLSRQSAELIRQGKPGDAMAQLRAAIDAAPDYAPAHCGLGDALAAQGYIDQAIAEYRRALAIDPNLASAQQGLQRLAQ
jgi:protein O-mannosyl-transferase